jgi:hypothetical protein
MRSRKTSYPQPGALRQALPQYQAEIAGNGDSIGFRSAFFRPVIAALGGGIFGLKKGLIYVMGSQPND